MSSVYNELPIMSIENPTLAHFLPSRGSGTAGRHFSPLFIYVPIRHPSTSVENVLQISPFYAKQTQFTKCPNRLNYLYNNELCDFYQSDKSQKQTQFKPNQTQFKPISRPNKAKTNPIQTQFVERAKLMQSVYLQRIMKKNASMGHEKQSQFKPCPERSRMGQFQKPISALNFYDCCYPTVFWARFW